MSVYWRHATAPSRRGIGIYVATAEREWIGGVAPINELAGGASLVSRPHLGFDGRKRPLNFGKTVVHDSCRASETVGRSI